MRTFRDAKAMAKALRTEALDRQQVDLSHSEALEIVARQFGFDNWNILAAKITSETGDGGDTNQENAGLRLTPAIPILRIFSEEKAKEFYVDFLGCTVDWEHRFEDNSPLYLQVSRSELTLHLSEHHGDASPGSTVYIWMSGVDEFQQELIGKNYRYAKPGITEDSWSRGVQLGDPFGNTLRFAEPTDSRSKA
ncbi:glyoxalase superfamily protein [Actinopolymorpha sp. B9G3]|uniref:glyoxalase superfamily protein n=1 Tax=Actinopolymorpha sp. B9G3 TaxID=3158970 RepID=UPI0032D93B0B